MRHFDGGEAHEVRKLRVELVEPREEAPDYQLDTFNSAFRLLAAYYRATKSSAKSDSL